MTLSPRNSRWSTEDGEEVSTLEAIPEVSQEALHSVEVTTEEDEEMTRMPTQLLGGHSEVKAEEGSQEEEAEAEESRGTLRQASLQSPSCHHPRRSHTTTGLADTSVERGRLQQSWEEMISFINILITSEHLILRDILTPVMITSMISTIFSDYSNCIVYDVHFKLRKQFKEEQIPSFM